MKVVLIMALPQEATYIVKSLGAKKVKRYPFITWTASTSSKEITIVQSGMGSHNAEAAWNYVVYGSRPDYVIAAGFCGAFYEGAEIGDLIGATYALLYPEVCQAVPASRRQSYFTEVPGAEEVVSKLTGAVAMQEGSVLTFDRWLKKSDVGPEILQVLPFPVCDMETFPLAKLSVQQELPFFVVRAVTDRAHEEIPQELFGVTDIYGNFSLSRALGTILSNPKLIPSCIRIGKNARIASQKLCEALEALLCIL